MSSRCGRFARWALPAVLMVSLVGCAHQAKAPTTRPAGTASALPSVSPLPPLPILSPTALTADAGDGKVFLRWNPQLEDERIIHWQARWQAVNGSAVIKLNSTLSFEELTEALRRVAPTEDNLTACSASLAEPFFIALGLQNGQAYTFSVVGILKDGTTTPQSNAATVTPRAVGRANVATTKSLDADWDLPIQYLPPPISQPRGRGRGPATRATTQPTTRAAGLVLRASPTKIIFPDGQELVYDTFRPIDWKAADGTHLIYPGTFGNGLDIGQFDDRGLPLVLPPGKGDGTDQPYKVDPVLTDGGSTPLRAIHVGYKDLQFGTSHPWITDPLTLPLQKFNHDAAAQWLPPEIDGDRVTLHYRMPLGAMGYRAFTHVEVWETWWPIGRERHGCTYRGLARQIEVQLPSSLKNGYQVMINNGFGPNGSRQGVKSYSAGFRVPAHEIVDYSPDRNQGVTMQISTPPRVGYDGYHPDQDCLQAQPLIFYDWSDPPLPGLKPGCLTISARGLYYHASQKSCSYVEQGADGVWPNLAWDCTISGKRTAVDTVEYLYASEPKQPLPQRYVNARFEVYGDVSKRMGVQDALVCSTVSMPHFTLKTHGGPIGFADFNIKRLAGTGIDGLGQMLDTWEAIPDIYPDSVRCDPDSGVNAELKAGNEKLRAAGIVSGCWLRPELVRTSLTNLLSDRYDDLCIGQNVLYPPSAPIIQGEGEKTVRENLQWVRRQRTGAWPTATPYHWVPMSLATEWWDRIIWPTIHTGAATGRKWYLHDGGFAGLAGVDYAPMLAGKTDSAVPAQPYWWRMYRSMHHVGIGLIGECSCGWVGGDVNLVNEDDQPFSWMFQMGVVASSARLKPEQLHKLYQLYNLLYGDPPVHGVTRFAKKFHDAHPGAPAWIELVDLKPGEQIEVTISKRASYIAGVFEGEQDETPQKLKLRPWTWSDAIWHFADGSSAVYPAFDKMDWSKQ